MNEIQGQEELAIEESQAASLSRIPSGIDTVELVNRTGTEVEEDVLGTELARVSGVERIRSLTVTPSSRVKNLRFLESLPWLQNLQVNGLRLQTLEGLEKLGNGRLLNLDTGRNRRRDAAKIAEARISRLMLEWARPEDLDAIAGSTTITELSLSSCPPLALDRWQGVPIETLSLFGGTITELAGTRHVASLRKLTLYNCSHLERFSGDNGNVTWMVIQRCKNLDLRTISTFRNLEFLAVPKLGKAQAIELSRANPGVLISNGAASYRDGRLET